MSAQSAKEIEEREANGTITLHSLRDAANAMDLKLVYGFVSKHESLEQMIEKRAKQLATEIVMRTHATMTLEDQQNSKERIEQSITQKTAEIKFEMPKYLWD
jgi:predicted DNA-binding mobile mystery protein A